MVKKHRKRVSNVTGPGRLSGELNKLQSRLISTVRAGKYEDAIAVLKALLHLEPYRFDLYNLLGDLSLQTKEFGEAIEAFSKALQIDPKHPDVYVGLGLALHEFKRFDGAAASFEIAVLYDAMHHRALGYQALSLMEMKQYDRALALLEMAIGIDPDDPTHYLNKGQLLSRMGRDDEALSDYERAVALRPEDAAFRLGQSAQWYRMRNYDAALDAIDRLVSAGRADSTALNFRGAVLGELGRFAESAKAYDAAIQMQPDFKDAKFNKALNCLMRGDFEQGLPLYEYRFERSSAPAKRHFAGDAWRGDAPLNGRSILIHTEQGLGDVLQFSRYILDLSLMAGRVVFEIPEQLFTLFGKLPDNVTPIRLGHALPACDFYCPLMSLPFAFNTRLESIPTALLPLTASFDADWICDVMSNNTQGLKVGVVWSGNAAHSNDHNRSLSFDEFSWCIEDLPHVICLQQEIRDTDRSALDDFGRMRIVSEHLKTMADTAALIQRLDLVITVDTSVAHLAATLGIPTWILLPSTPDFRWLIDRIDSPWYPAVRLFRQSQAKDWKSPLRQIRSSLAAISLGSGSFDQIRAQLLPDVQTQTRQLEGV